MLNQNKINVSDKVFGELSLKAVCGEESCCVQVSRDYFKRLENIDQWNRQDMWNKDISELPKEWTDSESFF